MMPSHAVLRSMVRTPAYPHCERAGAIQSSDSNYLAGSKEPAGGTNVVEKRRSDSPLPALLWWCALMLAVYALVAWLVW